MGEESSAATLITSYETASSDANELLQFFESIKTVDDINEKNLPSIVSDLQDKNTERAKKYIKCASITGGGVASAIGTTLAFGSLSAGISGATASTFAVASSYGLLFGAGALIPALGFFILPVASIPLILKLFQNTKVRHYFKDNKSKLEKTKKRIDDFHVKFQSLFDEIQNQISGIEKKLREDLSQKIDEYKEKTKVLAKEVAIEIDDIVNAGANERILKYNEIILKQYRLQKDLEEKLNYLYTKYDSLLKEKEELEKKLGILMQLLNTMGCPEAVINQALAHSGK